MKQPSRVPVWMLIIIIGAALPALAFPALLNLSAGNISEYKVLVRLYPIYVLVAAYLAWQCYGRRNEMTWILIILMILSHAAIWFLLTSSPK